MKRILYILTFIVSFFLKAAQENQDNQRLKNAIFDAFVSNNLLKIENQLQVGNTEGAYHFLISGWVNFYKRIEFIEQILNLFSRYNLDINQLYNYQTALYHALTKRCEVEFIKLLIIFGANVNKGFTQGQYSIPPIVITFYNFDCYKLLVENNADLYKRAICVDAFNNGAVLLGAIRYLQSNNYVNTVPKIILDLLIRGIDITLKLTHFNLTFFDYLTSESDLTKANLLQIVFEFITYILQAEGVDEIKGAQNALLIAAYLNEADLVRQLLEKGVLFNSEKYELYFNNLIADKPEIHAVIREYKNNLANNIVDQSQLIPDIANIICEF